MKVLYVSSEALPFKASGGLGDVAIRYGFYRYQKPLMYVCVILLVIITQIIQEAGLRIANKTDKRLH